jgi:hypothetical protein
LSIEFTNVPTTLAVVRRLEVVVGEMWVAGSVWIGGGAIPCGLFRSDICRRLQEKALLVEKRLNDLLVWNILESRIERLHKDSSEFNIRHQKLQSTLKLLSPSILIQFQSNL